MKKYYLFILSLLCLGFITANAAEKEVYSYTLAKGDFSGSTYTGITVNLGSLSWTLTGDGGYLGYDNGKGGQLGSGSKPYTTLNLSTDISSLNLASVTKVVVNTSGGSSIKATLKVLFDESDSQETATLTANATDFTFTPPTTLTSAPTKIALSYTQTSKKALYVKSITIYGEEAVDETKVATPVISAANEPTHKGYYYNGEETGDITISCTTPNATIYYDVDGGELQSGTSPITIPSVSKSTKIEAYAEATGLEDSEVAELEILFKEKPASVTYMLVDNIYQLSGAKNAVLAYYQEANNKLYMPSTLSSGKYGVTSISATTKPSEIELSEEDGVTILTITKTTDGYSIKDDENGYIQCPASGTSTTFSTEEVSLTLTKESDGGFKIYGKSNSRGLSFFDVKNSINYLANYAFSNNGYPLIYIVKEETIETETGLDAVLIGDAGRNYKINVPLVGRYYDSNTQLLFASTNDNSKAGSYLYMEPKDYTKSDGNAMAENDFIENDKLANFNQYDWVALKGFTETYVGVTIDAGFIATKVNDKNYPELYPVANFDEAGNGIVFTPNLYRPINFMARDKRKGENSADLFLVVPAQGEYCQVRGKLVKSDVELSEVSDTNGNGVYINMTAVTDNYNTLTDGEWYTFTGVYNGEEIVVTEAAKVATSVEGVEAAAINAYGVAGAIVVSANGAVEVYNMAGVKVAAAQVDGTMAITAAPGIYVVKAGTQTVKVAVK